MKLLLVRALFVGMIFLQLQFIIDTLNLWRILERTAVNRAVNDCKVGKKISPTKNSIIQENVVPKNFVQLEFRV